MIEAIILIIVLFSYYVYNTLEERDDIRQLQSNMDRSHIERSLFSKSRDLSHINEFREYLHHFDTIIKPFMDHDLSKKISDYKLDYLEKCNYYVELVEKRGLNENLGIEGAFRKSVHDVESIINKHNSYRLYTDMLQARRSEKDYIMRRKEKYVDKVKNSINNVIEHSKALDIPTDEKERIAMLSDTYLNSFYKLVDIFEEISNVEDEVVAIENDIQAYLDIMMTEKEDEANMILNSVVAVFAISIIVSLVLSVMLAKNITSPVESLQRAAHKIASGDLKTIVDVKTNDEIGDLANSFNSMVRSIKKSSDTILLQKNELHERKDELEQVAEELRSTLDNLSTLSYIGQSITSALRYEEIFFKLYEHMNSVINTSIFGIATINRKDDMIEYQVLIKESVNMPPKAFPLKDKSRIDAISLKIGEEILIQDLQRNDIVQYYPILKDKEIKTVFSDKSRSIMCLPFKSGKEVIGIITIESLEANAYKKHHLDFLRNLASYIAIAIKNAKSYEEINKAHDELKKAQTQLVQAEKMASLGQLTAGIAHEIKNPLNFIKNYSEGTFEIFDDISDILGEIKGSISEENYEDIEFSVKDIKEYLTTIMNNSKRIDNIVKSMMEHAHGGSGLPVLTDANDFVQEYVKLAYNGFRGQYKGFICLLNYNLDKTKPKIKIRQQDFSRVITNIVDNACYSTMKKQESMGKEYAPTLDIFVESRIDQVYIKIRDNGIGIQQEIIEKLFDPFFTTKPAGEGTGLGMSLSYDIVTNGHDGKFNIDTIVGEFAEFIITLPKANARS